MIEPGIYDISNEQYHASAGLSRSAIMELRKSPKHFYNRYVLRINQKKTAALEFGALFNTFVLEPHLFDDQFLPHAGIKTPKAKQEASGKKLFTEQEAEIALAMKKSLYAHEQAMILLKGAAVEKSIYWIDKETGLLCKARPDLMCLMNDAYYVGDLKTAEDASPKAFERAIFEYGYHIQAAMIREGLKVVKNISINDFYSIPVEKKEPFITTVYQLDDDCLDYGLEEFRAALKLYKKCFEKNEWPGYKARKIGLPKYAYYNN